jgi:predicted  nucleic acid-binding Zn-ribbon protein
MNAMEGLLAEINKLTAEPDGSLTYYACHQCGKTTATNNGPKSKCESCGSDGFQYPGATKEEASDRRLQGIGLAKPTTEAPAPIPEAPAKPKRVVKAKAETPPPAPPVTPVVAASVDVDFAAVREAKVAAFIKAHNLNEIQPVEVAEAIVQTVGFTVWADKRPIFRLHESFETGKEFAESYNEARAHQPATRIDICQCAKVTNPELEECLFKGDLIASLNSGHGTLRVQRGDKVKIGAYKTSTGKLRFAVIE